MYYFIVNRTGASGHSMEKWAEIKSRLDSSRIEYKYYVTEYKGHAVKLAEMICGYNDPDTKIIVVGGDGSINEVINGITDFEKVTLGIVPSGSGNDFINGLGMSSDTYQALDRVLNSKDTKSVDIGQVQGDDLAPKYFAISSGIGMDAIVCKKALTSKLKTALNKIHQGQLTYKLLTVFTLLSMEYIKCDVRFDDENKTYNKLIFLAAMNTPFEGGGVPMRPDADYQDGRLSFIVADSIGKTNAFAKLPKLIKGKHQHVKGFSFADAGTVSIHAEKALTLHIDGEYYGDVKDIAMKCIPSALNIIC